MTNVTEFSSSFGIFQQILITIEIVNSENLFPEIGKLRGIQL